jgi:hypothetical protein
MWCALILIQRPFIKRASSLEPLKTSAMAASKICLILEGYTENLPLLSCDLIFPIFTAASTLSHFVKGIDDKETKSLTERQIEMCVGWLRILGKSWKGASTRQELLTSGKSSKIFIRGLLTFLLLPSPSY